MPFESSGLTISRASYNAYCPGKTKCCHFYTSSDVLSEVSSSGYFPDYFGEEKNAIKTGDTIKISCWGESNLVQTELSFFYSVDSVAPVSLTQLDQLYTANYFNVPYSGAATGTLSLSFSRDPSKQISLYVIGTNDYFHVSSSNIINMSFSIPAEFLPDPIYYPSGFVGTMTSTDVNITGIPLVLINMALIGNSISFLQAPNVNFVPNQLLPIQNQFVMYQGITLN